MIPVGVDDEVRLRLVFGPQFFGRAQKPLAEKAALAQRVDVLVAEADARVFPVDVAHDAIE